jgi:hypothetical protein
VLQSLIIQGTLLIFVKRDRITRGEENEKDDPMDFGDAFHGILQWVGDSRAF